MLRPALNRDRWVSRAYPHGQLNKLQFYSSHQDPGDNKMVYVVAVHMEGGTAHEHIAAAKWRNPATNQSGASTREQIVSWIRDANGDARVSDGRNEVGIGVVNASPPYLRTHADGKWTDNLLALPRY